jgi:hypothetical protein
MIKLRTLIQEIIAEKMSFSDLMKHSDPKRIDRSKRIPTKSLVVNSVNNRESWKFSYKTPKDENTTGLRHQGFIYFFKENLSAGANALDIDCSVDCSCPDYKYRWAYNNAKAGAGEIGGNSLNRNNGMSPQINLGVGLCKHLLSLKEYLRTKIDSVPDDSTPNPTDKKPVVIPKSPDPKTMPPEEPDEPLAPSPTVSPSPVQPAVQPKEPLVKPNVDPTQTPEGPEIDPSEEPSVDNTDDDTQLSDSPFEDDPKKPNIKESVDTSKIIRAFDEICRTEKVFIVNYD